MAMNDLPEGQPLDCRACGVPCIPSRRVSGKDGEWIDVQESGLKFGGCCTFDCMKSLVVDDALRNDEKLSINVAKPKWGGGVS